MLPSVIHPLDQAVRFRAHKLVPAENQAEYQAILQAFQDYEAGRDEAARTALQAIGLTSPFSEWKLLLRGLMAYAANDGPKALENFQRLKPDRLPYHLAVPIRAKLDATFANSLPKAEADKYTKVLAASTDSPLLKSLQKLRTELSRDQPLKTAFATAEKLLPLLRSQAPELVQQLAVCFYAAIDLGGEPSDLGRYRKLFGEPAHDPGFCRLEALKNGHGNPEAGEKCWKKYLTWLTTNPMGWAPELLNRVRAIVLLCQEELAATDDEAEEFLWQALRVDPDFDKPLLGLLKLNLTTADQCNIFEQADDFLTRHPNNTAVLEALVEAAQGYGLREVAFRYSEMLVAANPLNTTYTALLVTQRVNQLHALALSSDYAQIKETLATESFWQQHPDMILLTALKYILAIRLKESVEQLQPQVDKSLNSKPVLMAYYLASEAAIFGLTPAKKKPFETAFLAALATATSPVNVIEARFAMRLHETANISYRGMPTHIKKCEEAILKSIESVRDLTSLEELFQQIVDGQLHELGRKLGKKMAHRFATNPLCNICYAECLMQLEDPSRPQIDATYRAVRLARMHLRANPTTEQDKGLHDRLANLEEELGAGPESFFDMFMDLMNRRRRN